MADETTPNDASFDADDGLEIDLALLVAALGGGPEPATARAADLDKPEGWRRDEAA